MVVHKILIDVSQKMRQFGRIHASDRHRVAMTPTEMLKLFDGMAESMSIVQEFAQSRLLKIGGHMVGLHAHGMFDQLCDHILQIGIQERRPVEGTQFIGIILKNLQNFRIHDETGLDDLTQALDENVVRQRCERL